MRKAKKDEIWLQNDEIEFEVVGKGAVRKILSYEKLAMCVENHFVAKSIGPVHVHPHTQIAYVTEGVFEFQVNDEKRVIKKGDSVLVPANIPHGCLCLEDGIIVDFFTPMREDFV